MSEPVAMPVDLASYLGREVDERMGLVLDLAHDLCASVVDPLPDAARAVVLAVAARAYSNVSSASQVGMGSAFASFSSTGGGGVGGLYLSRADKATLRRLSGRGGAFSVDPVPEF